MDMIFNAILDFIADNFLSFDFVVEDDAWDDDIDMETIV